MTIGFCVKSSRKARSFMKRQTAQWVHKAEKDWEVAHKLAGESPAPRDIVCFHCQQAAEKYLKALLQEGGLAVPKTHDLVNVLNLLCPAAAKGPFVDAICGPLSLSRRGGQQTP